MKRIAVFAVLLVFYVAACSYSATIYVKFDSPGSALDGKSWETAFHTVQEGIDAAATGDEVWVAKGTYAQKIKLKADVSVKGGYSGLGESRDIKSNITTLKDPSSSPIFGVVTTADGAAIDGFTITGGYDGVVCHGGSPIISNNVIKENSHRAVYIREGSPIIEANLLMSNMAGVISAAGSPIICRNTITQNSYKGISLCGSPIIISNFIFTNANEGIECETATALIANNTVAFNLTGISLSETEGEVVNNIVAFNNVGIKNSKGTASLRKNDLYGNIAGNYSGLDAGETDISADPEFACPDFGDFHISSSSACRNAGDSQVVETAALDVDGQDRIEGPAVDIGADESHGENYQIIPRIIYVNASAPYGGDGRTWQSAYNTIQAAINDNQKNGLAEIWVAKGIYRTEIESPSLIYLYGGFAGTETSKSERNVQANATILMSTETGSSKPGVTLQYTSSIDGFTLARFTTGIKSSGVRNSIRRVRIIGCENGVSIADGCTVEITNSILSGNTKGIYGYHASLRAVNNTIVHNGTGIYLLGGVCTAINNIVAFNDTGIWSYEKIQPLSHNNVYGNNTDYSGTHGLEPGVTDISIDPQFASIIGGNYHIMPSSPCRNAGDDSVITTGETDFDGQSRIEGTHVDIGADESYGEVHSYPPRTIFVNCTADSSGDGTSWATAYNTIRKAMDDTLLNGGAEVWVAKGVYEETFVISQSTAVYGGFIGSELVRDERNPRANRTVIDGGSTTVDYTQTVAMARESSLDGFIVTGGRVGVRCNSGCTVSGNVIMHSRESGIEVGGQSTICGNIIAANGSYGIYCGSYISAVITNNTVVGHNVGVRTSGGTNLILTSNIVAFNDTGINGSMYYTPIELSYNDVYGNRNANYHNVQAGDTDISADPMFVSLQYGDFHIRPDSPCRNAGPAKPAYPRYIDIDGQDRNEGDAVDIGADESYGEDPIVEPRLIYVDKLPHGCGGGGWPTAYYTINQALKDARQNGPAEIWVARGTYQEQVQMVAFTYLYGGFSGYETSESERNIQSNPTIIKWLYDSCVIGANYATLDGFNIQGGIYCNNASPILTNNIISGNNSAGISCTNSSPMIKHNTIFNNGHGVKCSGGAPLLIENVLTENNGSGVLCTNGSSPLLKGNIITANKMHGIAYSGGKTTIVCNTILNNGVYGIGCTAATTEIMNNLIAGNKVAGFQCRDCSLLFTNNIIVSNTSTSANGIVFENRCNGDISNNIVYGHRVGILMLRETSIPKLISNCVYGNTKADYLGLNKGEIDISANPLFADPTNGDYHLLPNSPCIDAGSLSSTTPTTDLDGNPRPKDGNGDGIALPDIGCYETPANYIGLAGAKGLADGSAVGISGPISTAIFADRFYAESADRTCGIGILGGVSSTGRRVTVEGVMATVDGERVIVPGYTHEGGSAPVPAPYFMSYNALGGGPIGLQRGVSDWRLVPKINDTGETVWVRDIFSYGGANNIGLLVKTTGRVTNRGNGYFYLDGTCPFDDGDERVKGIRVDWPFESEMPPDGSFVEVTAISSCTESDEFLVRMLRPISPEAVNVLGR